MESRGRPSNNRNHVLKQCAELKAATSACANTSCNFDNLDTSLHLTIWIKYILESNVTAVHQVVASGNKMLSVNKMLCGNKILVGNKVRNNSCWQQVIGLFHIQSFQNYKLATKLTTILQMFKIS